jgi:hypothetical protein
MKVNIGIVETDNQIKQAILSALVPEVDDVMKKSVRNIKNRLTESIKASLVTEPEYSSLVNGQLKYELGIADSSSVDKIIDAVLNTISVQVKKTTIVSNGFKGGISITVLSGEDVQGLIKTDIASVFDSKGYYLPWLEWLLLKGTSPLVKQFEVKLGPNSSSRTGNAIMVKSASNWSVPPAFAGKESNNWFTRALSKLNDNDITTIIQTEIEKNI